MSRTKSIIKMERCYFSTIFLLKETLRPYSLNITKHKKPLIRDTFLSVSLIRGLVHRSRLLIL